MKLPLRVRLAALLLAAMSVGWAGAEATWGVRIDVDLPADSGLVEFVQNPLAYGLGHRDVLDARMFVEVDGRWGVEGRWRSSTELYAGPYLVLARQSALGQSAESSLGLYVGRDLRAGQNFLSLRGTILLYGTLP